MLVLAFLCALFFGSLSTHAAPAQGTAAFMEVSPSLPSLPMFPLSPVLPVLPAFALDPMAIRSWPAELEPGQLKAFPKAQPLEAVRPQSTEELLSYCRSQLRMGTLGLRFWASNQAYALCRKVVFPEKGLVEGKPANGTNTTNVTALN